LISQDAQRAIAELNDTELMGRLIFVREDREGSGGSYLTFPDFELTLITSNSTERSKFLLRLFLPLDTSQLINNFAIGGHG
jgi:RNA recognition motif-containing protein